MPRKLRISKRRSDARLKAAVIAFLESGDLAAAYSENRWMWFSLRFYCEPARKAHAAGDWAAVHAALAKAPGSQSFYL
jgi:hypothetical protein